MGAFGRVSVDQVLPLPKGFGSDAGIKSASTRSAQHSLMDILQKAEASISQRNFLEFLTSLRIFSRRQVAHSQLSIVMEG